MSLLNCLKCDYPNEHGAAVCEWCGTGLDGGSRARASGRGAQSVSYGAVAGASGTGASESLPIDFHAAPFTLVSDVLGPTFRLYRENFMLIGKIVLVLAIPQALAQYAVTGEPRALWLTSFIMLTLASTVVSSLMTGALVYGVVELLRTGVSPSLKACYAWGLKKWWRVFACSLLLSFITGLGFILLIIPGIILMLVFAVALPVAVVEDHGPVSALERSAQLTKGYRGLIFLTGGLLWVIIAVATFVVGGVGAADGVSGSLFVILVYTLITQMLQSAFTVLSLFIYLGIRADRDEKLARDGFAAAQS